MSIRGSCLCGEVSYEVSGPYPTAWHCHCSQSRRAHGASCGSYLGVEPENFKWLSGEALVKTYAPEDDPEAHPDQHIFVGSKASWVKIGDDLPQNDEYPPGFDAS